MRPAFSLDKLPLVNMFAVLLVCSVIHAQEAPHGNADFDRGVRFYEAARYTEAAEAFNDSVKRERSNAEAYYFLANSYVRMLRYKDALKAYRKAIELNPGHLLAYNNLGTTYHALGDFKSALDAYEKALKIAPDYPEAVFGVGVVYLELKEKERAIEQHKKLVAIDIKRADKLYEYINNKISLSVLNVKALQLPQPIYPSVARVAHAYGVVIVLVSIDEAGTVISASAVTGHPLLRSVTVDAAKLARFSPTLLNGRPVKVTGIITYNFVAP